MSNKTDLQTLNTDYATLIDTLRGKAVGGGGAVETCTVTIDNNTGMNINYITYVTAVNGERSLAYAESFGDDVVLSNVVVGSNIVIYVSDAIQKTWSSDFSLYFSLMLVYGDEIHNFVCDTAGTATITVDNPSGG